MRDEGQGERGRGGARAQPDAQDAGAGPDRDGLGGGVGQAVPGAGLDAVGGAVDGWFVVRAGGVVDGLVVGGALDAGAVVGLYEVVAEVRPGAAETEDGGEEGGAVRHAGFLLISQG
ncbi:hypothetical protein [Streptomyces sp. TRM70308]|uniref:hypothetical protein n=1 Tax=Streptomyces sp. TRM70308 TaxID=3131932 RepID=UPI003D08AB88